MHKSDLVPASHANAASLSGLRGQNIVCFAKDWNEDPTSCNHVLRNLAKHNKVLWVNSISTRAPNLASGRDIKKIFRRVSEFLIGFIKGAQPVGDQMWLFNPFVLPFHHSPWAVKLNQAILRFTIGVQRRRLGMKDFQLWTFVPTSAEYVGRLGESLVVYYCTDEWSGFSFVDGKRMESLVQDLSTKADVVFATSRTLVTKLSAYNANTHLASHGVSYEMFAQALKNDLPLPEDVSSLKGPVLGFYGLIEEWMDQDLLAHLARKHPEWTILLIGKVCVDTQKLAPHSNIKFLGRKPHHALPAYCKAFDVALIPHKVNKLTIAMNPIKLREYMSAGLKIVSTDLPEMKLYPEHCITAASYDEFEQGVVRALADNSAAGRQARSAPMARETWEYKVLELGEIVKQSQQTKSERR
ncbi:MAG: hypothetical protein RI907_1420 [Pseudomonadota bacterium]|jgi:glycosyltransferase involved in cell wall biosynthesis